MPDKIKIMQHKISMITNDMHSIFVTCMHSKIRGKLFYKGLKLEEVAHNSSAEFEYFK